MILPFLWTLAPLAWGFSVWLFSFGPASFLQFPYGLLCLAFLLLFSWILYQPLTHAYREYQLHFFEYVFKLPAWTYFVIITGSALLIRYLLLTFTQLTVNEYPALNSLIMGVLMSACLEELLARSVLVIYPLRTSSMILINILMSLSFSYMHMGFEMNPEPWSNYLLTRGHFLFSISLGLIAYKTKRIELCILLHMLSNLCNYTLPVLVLSENWKYPLSIVSNFVLFLALAGCWSKKRG